MVAVALPPVDGPGSNAKELIDWLQARPEEELVTSAQALFEKILHIASQPRSATKDACVKLCGFIQLCAKSSQESLRQWAFREETIKDLFNYYLEWNEKDAHRSMRLALDSVSTLMLQNPDHQVQLRLKAEFLSTLVSIIARKSMRPVVKSCLSSLTQFLTKGVLGLDDIARQYVNLRRDLAGQPTIIVWQSWVAEIFKWMELHYICPVAGKFLVVTFCMLSSEASSAGEGRDEFNVRVLRTWLETALSANPDILESVKNYVFAPMFKSDRRFSFLLLVELNESRPVGNVSSPNADATALLHLAALEVGKKCSIVDEPSLTGAKPVKDMIILDRRILDRFLIHPSPEVRSFAVSLLITSSTTTRPYSPMAFELLRRHLKSFHSESDPKFRSEILQHAKNMVKRIMSAISVLQKDIDRLSIKHSKVDANGIPANYHISKGAKQIVNAGETWLRESLRDHKGFFNWYLTFLLQELVPTASYQRHITALKSLVNVLKLGAEHPGSIEQRIYQDSQWLRVILDLIMDPFEDVRETAVGLLMLYPADAVRTKSTAQREQSSTRPLDTLIEFCLKAADLASRTSRADHSDGAARSLGLLCAWQETFNERLGLLSKTLDELEEKISLAEKDLGQAVMTVPVHGTFAAVRCVWEVLSQSTYSPDELQRLAEAQTRIIGACTRTWDTVSYVLCDDSPEGHLPEELEEIEGLDTKGLLSYSFRATHESSNLLRTIVGNLRSKRSDGYLLPTPEVFKATGDLAYTQLSTLRHRGAFSSVSLTFTCCCQNAQHTSIVTAAENRTLLETWYNGTLTCISTQRSTTRRSAGIPSLMTGILTSNAESPSFQEVIRSLQRIAAEPARVTETDGSNLPQVHAFNCLKEIFKSSLLSKHAELYLSECLELATSSLKSEVWAIRNCALLLLRSLIDTLFGTTESKSTQETGWDGKTLRLSYTKYSALPPILLSLLQSGEQAMEPGTLAQSSAAESVFPALEIIRRAGPPESNRDELYGYITKYLGSRQWHVREIAARTLCSFLVSGDWLAAVQGLLHDARGSANKLHGTLLTIKFFLERTFAETKDEGPLAGIKHLDSLLAAFKEDALMCSETLAAYIEVFNLIREFTPSEKSSSLEIHLADVVARSPNSNRFSCDALLNSRAGTMALRNAAVSRDLEALQQCLFNALQQDIDTACALIEAALSIWGQTQNWELCNLFLKACKYTKVPEARAVALTNLANLMSASITSGKLQDLPPIEDLETFQHSLQDNINPALGNAIILASGSIMAIHALKHNGQMSFFTFEQRLRSWGRAIADALHDSNTFDMRMAAAKSLQSFVTGLRSAVSTDAAYLPLLLALYMTLVDDDEEIREVGALAAAFAMAEGDARPQALVAVDAVDALLAWIQRHFGQTNEFRAYAACRLVGDPLIAIDIGVQDLDAWVPAEEQFAEALKVDESLFVVEEQNLFIDEVRETERWAETFRKIELDFDEIEEEDGSIRKVLMMDSSLTALKSWTEGALAVVAEQVVHDDGPLGWASNPAAFALCHRVLTCGTVLSEVLGPENKTIVTLLLRIQSVAQNSRLHGLLLSTLNQSKATHKA
ncbi:hypothetical protein N0V93_005263 [Gnomoniopsis smithogilvyi]|uniref:DUF2428 domain-containing protein n=1 Tax=Gnomoniopsis smithogilvyi TaxID=1191159 RepID=A0A9W8YSZ9_9PEZI|nr:hypothetical protein N0V93_005263 [Gnomoniopsis smithogilvyi]